MPLRKYLLPRCLIVLFVVLLLGISTTSFAQTALDRKIDFKTEQLLIKDALELLATQTGLPISFSSNFFDDQLISIDVSNESIAAIINTILEDQKVKHKFKNNRIYLSKARLLRHSISGFLEDTENGERLIGATIYCPEHQQGTTSNEYGFYSLTLPPGKVNLIYSYIGYPTSQRAIELKQDLRINQQLKTGYNLPEVVVHPQEETPLFHQEHESYVLDKKNRKAIPGLGGQADPIRAAEVIPGVQSAVDGLGGLIIRGGDPGQNLFVLDGVPVYIPYHLLGLYSVYNPATINTTTILKGAFPARYGGRLSSIFDIRTREGNKYNFAGQIGASLTTSNLLLEGPLKKEKGSFLVAGRISHAIPLLGNALDRIYFQGQEGELEAEFADLNIKLNYELGNKDRVYLSFFHGTDEFSKEYSEEDEIFIEEFEFEFYWNNTIGAIRWNHLFNDKLFLNTTLTGSLFNYELSSLSQLDSLNSFDDQVAFYNTRSSNKDLGVQSDLNWIPNPNHNIRLGLGFSRKAFVPDLTFFDEDDDEISEIEEVTIQSLQGLVNSPLHKVNQLDAYLEDEIKIGKNLHANVGLRQTAFFAVNQTFLGLEPRITLHYHALENLQLRASAGRMRQYLHLISAATLALPNDLWTPSSKFIDPQNLWLYEGTINIQPKENWELELGGYFKKMKNLYAYPDNESFTTLNGEDEFEQLLTKGNGQSFGFEGLLGYQGERTGGMASAVYSETTRTFEFQNLGDPYPFEFDQRWQYKFFLYHQLSDRWTLSANWSYHSPNPQFQFSVDNTFETDPTILNPLGAKNEARATAYHRLDLQAKFIIPGDRFSHEFTFGTFNTYNRKNTAYYHSMLNDQSGQYDSRNVSSLPFIPSVSYNLLFKTVK